MAPTDSREISLTTQVFGVPFLVQTLSEALVGCVGQLTEMQEFATATVTGCGRKKKTPAILLETARIGLLSCVDGQ